MWWQVADTQRPLNSLLLCLRLGHYVLAKWGALLTASKDTQGRLVFQPERLRCAQLPAEGSAPQAKSEQLIQVPALQPGERQGSWCTAEFGQLARVGGTSSSALITVWG